MIYGGHAHWMEEVARPFAVDLGARLTRSGMAWTDETIPATAVWYQHVETTAAADINDYLTVQFAVTAGIAPWVMGHGLDAASKALTAAMKKMVTRHRKNTAGQPRGVAVRVEADFEPDRTVVVLESDLHYDTDAGEVADAFAAACRTATRSRTRGVLTYRASTTGVRRVAGDRARTTRRPVLTYSTIAADPTAGPLQRAIAASGAESVKLLGVAQFLEQHPGEEWPVDMIAHVCGCSPRLVTST
jgi:hypothetical protein